MPSVTFGGLASGLDTKAMIDAILNAERKPLERLQSRVALFNQRKSAFEELRGKLKEFESSLRDLTSSRRFRARTATVSDESVLRATPGTGAETGIFEIEVLGLAAADKFKSAGQPSADQGLIADGTITIQSGNNDQITVDVSAADGTNTLDAVRDAINAADAGVQAAIIYDGSAYRLTVRAEETGSANALTISDTTSLNLDDAANRVTTAADASVVVDGIDVSSSGNRLTGIIPGVTLDLLTETGGQPITVEVAQNNDGVVEAAGDLVNSYNDLVDFLNAQFNRENPGPLAGDSTTLRVQSRLQTLLTSGVEGIPFGSLRSLSSIGVDFDGKTGKATLDSAKLRELLDTQFDAVGNVFLSAGTASDSRVQYVGAGTSTLAGSYAVEVTQAAEQASLSAATALTALGQDETLTIASGGASADISLTAGQTLSEAIETINAGLRSSDVAATAFSDGGVLRIVSNEFGSNADVSVTSDRDDPGDGSGTGFGTATATDLGVDVSGTIDGVAATGAGRTLVAGDETDAAGLRLQITASADYIAANGGDLGTVGYSRGLVDTLLSEVRSVTRFNDGPIDLARESLDGTIKSLNQDIDRITERISQHETRLIRAFSAAEQAISALQAQQSSLNGVQF